MGEREKSLNLGHWPHFTIPELHEKDRYFTLRAQSSTVFIVHFNGFLFSETSCILHLILSTQVPSTVVAQMLSLLWWTTFPRYEFLSHNFLAELWVSPDLSLETSTYYRPPSFFHASIQPLGEILWNHHYVPVRTQNRQERKSEHHL